MKRFVFAGFFSVMFVCAGIAFGKTPADTTQLKAQPIYGKEAKVVAYILDNNHYRKLSLNDSLSASILTEYIKSLDNNKQYFTASDIAGFEKYRYSIDDLTRSENVDVAFEIFAVFRTRFNERMNYIMNKLISEKFDYSADEYYETD